MVAERPSENDLRNLLEPGTSHGWRTARPPRAWAVNDRVFVWAGSPVLRVVGLAVIVRIALRPNAVGETIFTLRYTTGYLTDGPTVERLRRVRSLASASFLKSGPSGTLFPLTPVQADALFKVMNAERDALPEELPSFIWSEGAAQSVVVNRYERSAAARRQCVAHHGFVCCVCGIDFEKRYGSFAHGFIHVHHLRPLSLSAREYDVDPITDLRPVCPNCHAMLHYGCEQPRSIAELKAALRQA